MPEFVDDWRDPVFQTPPMRILVALATRIDEIAEELTAGLNISEAIAQARLPDPPRDHPLPIRAGHLPRNLRIYYERLHVLLAVVMVATDANPATFDLTAAPTETERRFGTVLGEAFHQGCTLADVALAAGLPADQVIYIGKRTIRRTKWLERLEQ